MLAILEGNTDSPPSILDEVPNWFEDWEQTLSRFRPDSELSRLNRTFDQPVKVSDTLWDVFQYALSAETITNGLVTPTVLDAMLEAGYDQSFDDPAALSKSTWLAGFIGCESAFGCYVG